MLEVEFAVNIVSSLDHPLTADNTYTVVSSNPCRVLGFTIDPSIILPLTITVASADGSVIYFVYTLDGTTATHIVESVPFIADKGLAWKSTGLGVFSVFVTSTFFLMNPGT